MIQLKYSLWKLSAHCQWNKYCGALWFEVMIRQAKVNTKGTGSGQTISTGTREPMEDGEMWVLYFINKYTIHHTFYAGTLPQLQSLISECPSLVGLQTEMELIRSSPSFPPLHSWSPSQIPRLHHLCQAQHLVSTLQEYPGFGRIPARTHLSTGRNKSGRANHSHIHAHISPGGIMSCGNENELKKVTMVERIIYLKINPACNVQSIRCCHSKCGT